MACGYYYCPATHVQCDGLHLWELVTVVRVGANRLKFVPALSYQRVFVILELEEYCVG
jgi:hypothetical protein